MAGDWIKIDLELPEKPEVLRLHEATGVPIDALVGRLFLFWRLGDSMTTDGLIGGAGPRGLASKCGGTPEFWEIMARVVPEWIVLTDEGARIPGFCERFGSSRRARRADAVRKKVERRQKAEGTVAGQAPDSGRTPDTNVRPRPPLSVSESESVSETEPESPSAPEPARDETRRDDQINVGTWKKEKRLIMLDECARMFKSGQRPLAPHGAKGLQPKDFDLLVKVAVLAHVGRIPLAAVQGALASVHKHGSGTDGKPIEKPFAFFQTVLADEVAKRVPGHTLNGLLARVQLPADLDRTRKGTK